MDLRLNKPLIAELEFSHHWSLQTIESYLLYLHRAGINTVGIFGEDPFLSFDKLKGLLDIARDLNIYLVITTDLSSMDAEKAGILRGRKVTVRINLCAICDSGSRNQPIISALISNQICLAAYVPISQHTWKRIDEYAETARELAITSINFLFIPDIRLPRLIYWAVVEKILEAAQKNNLSLLSDFPLLSFFDSSYGGICPAGRVSIFVNSEGKLKPCRYFPDASRHISGIEQYWNGNEVCDFAKVPVLCANCNILERCGGGCRVYNYLLDQNNYLNEKDYYCLLRYPEKQRQAILDLVKLFNYYYSMDSKYADFSRHFSENIFHVAARDDLSLFEQLINEVVGFSEDSFTLNLKAGVLHQLGRFNEAALILEKLLAKESNDFILHNLANAYFGLNRFAEAQKLYLEIAARGSMDDKNNLGCCYLKTGAYDQARICFEELVALQPDSLKYWNHLGLTLMLLDNYSEAITAFSTALRLAVHNLDKAKILTNIGIAAAKSGDEKAGAFFEQALLLVPDFEFAQINKKIWLQIVENQQPANEVIGEIKNKITLVEV
ncbi:MAG: tetratricopeptide repeat protein [Firmicutes bacterium]|nr:tetratricopeptide repeat protein [Bacillota bacterium]